MPSITQCDAAQLLVHANRRAKLVEQRSLVPKPQAQPYGAHRHSRTDTLTETHTPTSWHTSHARVHQCRTAHHRRIGALAHRQNDAHRHRRTDPLTQSLGHSRPGHQVHMSLPYRAWHRRQRLGRSRDWHTVARDIKCTWLFSCRAWHRRRRLGRSRDNMAHGDTGRLTQTTRRLACHRTGSSGAPMALHFK